MAKIVCDEGEVRYRTRICWAADLRRALEGLTEKESTHEKE